jgi:hypothetical protein
MTIKRWLISILLLANVALAAVVAAQGFHIISVLFTNTSGIDQANLSAPFNLSSVTLVDGLYVDADVLNTDAQKAGESIAYMPGTTRVRMLGCFDEGGNDETVDCNDAGQNDITLPTTGSAVFEFAADNQFRHLWFDIGTAAVASWTCEWQFWDGSAYIPFTGVTDGSNCFRNAAFSRTTWDFPAVGQWPESTLHSIDGYWAQVEITSFVSVTTAPLGNQVWYETGRWWTLLDELAAGQQAQVDVHLGTTAVTGSDTFAISASGSTRGDDAAYPPAFDTAAASSPPLECTAGGGHAPRRSLSGGVYTILTCFLRFDTSSIPDDASVTSGTLNCTADATGPFNANSRNLALEWYSWSAPLSGAQYQTIAQVNAGSVALSAITPSGPLPITLTNLYRVDKGGFSGFRVSIDGGIPTGANLAGIADCSVTLEWELPKSFHWYAPNLSGYTLPDDATLEPGGTFAVTISGFFGASGAGELLTKGSDLRIYFSAVDNLRVDINGVLVISNTIAGFSNDPHVITLAQNGTGATARLILLVDGVELAAVAAAAITDNASDWVFAQDNSIAALEYLEYEVSQVTQFTHQIRDIPDHLLVNQSNPGTFDAIARYPDTVNGLDVSVEPTESVSGAGEPEAPQAPELIGEFPAITGFSEVSDQPTGGLMDVYLPFSQALGIPFSAVLGAVAIALSFGGAAVAGRIGGSFLAFGAALVVLMGLFAVLGALTFWVPLLTAVIVVPLFLAYRRFHT